jgi:hypothetical protein
VDRKVSPSDATGALSRAAAIRYEESGAACAAVSGNPAVTAAAIIVAVAPAIHLRTF